MSSRRRVGAVAAGLALAGAAACSSGAPPGVPSPRPGAAPLSWIVGGSTLRQLRAADTTGDLTRRFFDTANAYVVTSTKDWAVPASWTSTPTAGFTSFAMLQTALDEGRLDPRIRAVLYDNERWAQTPAAEQRDPVRYDRLAADVVHSHHLLFIATPAVDLTQAPAAADRYHSFLSSGLVGSIARTADVVDIQAQASETDAQTYDAFVEGAAAQARRSNPAVVVLAGISTNPAGHTVTAATVMNAVRPLRGAVDGYWLNDPAPSAACPTCAGPFPRVSLGVLAALDQSVRGRSG